MEVAVSGAMTQGRAGMAPSDIEGLYECGVRVFTDDGDSVDDTDVLRSVMTRVVALPGAVVAQHAEDAAMTAGGHIHDGSISARLRLGGLPAEAEIEVVRRDLDLVRETGVSYHCQHVSAAGTVELIRDAKSDGLPISAEVTPHHLSFDDTELADLDTDFKMYPPLRSAYDRRVLREALNDGTIDVVATDHAPHTPQEKNTSFGEAPRGVIGLETAASVVSGIVDKPSRLFQALSLKPASVAGLRDQGRPIVVGEPANIVVFDPRHQWTPDKFASRSSNSPYKGHHLIGRPVLTVHSGRIVYRLGKGFMKGREPALLATADGEVFRGSSVGGPGVATGEAVFNTSMTGYQEILTDPSYAGQVVVMTSPHIGNYGVFDFDAQSSSPAVSGFIMRSLSRRGSSDLRRAGGQG